MESELLFLLLSASALIFLLESRVLLRENTLENLAELRVRVPLLYRRLCRLIDLRRDPNFDLGVLQMSSLFLVGSMKVWSCGQGLPDLVRMMKLEKSPKNVDVNFNQNNLFPTKQLPLKSRSSLQLSSSPQASTGSGHWSMPPLTSLDRRSLIPSSAS